MALRGCGASADSGRIEQDRLPVHIKTAPDVVSLFSWHYTGVTSITAWAGLVCWDLKPMRKDITASNHLFPGFAINTSGIYNVVNSGVEDPHYPFVCRPLRLSACTLLQVGLCHYIPEPRSL